jgi:hypothetical protein
MLKKGKEIETEEGIKQANKQGRNEGERER